MTKKKTRSLITGLASGPYELWAVESEGEE